MHGICIVNRLMWQSKQIIITVHKCISGKESIYLVSISISLSEWIWEVSDLIGQHNVHRRASKWRSNRTKFNISGSNTVSNVRCRTRRVKQCVQLQRRRTCMSTHGNVRRRCAICERALNSFTHTLIKPSLCLRPRKKGGAIKLAAVSVHLSVPCLNITRERKGLGDPNLAGWKPVIRVPPWIYLEVKRSKVKVNRRINAHTVNAQYLPNGKAYEVKTMNTRIRDKRRDLQGQRSRSQGHV